MRLHSLLLFCLVFCMACKTKNVSTTSNTTPPPKQEDYASHAITNVNLISMVDDKIKPKQTVLIKDGKIFQILDNKAIRLPPEVKLIDAQGKYLMPGLSEMHAHIPVAQDGDETYVKETLFLYLANGITTIRGMLGNPYHLELKTKAANGEIPSPRIYTSSPSMNGNTIPTKEQAREKTIQYQKEGYDFLKVHPGIPLEAFNEMVKTANEVGIPFSGHVPMDVGIHRAIEAKSNLCKATKEAGIWIVPTQSLMVRVTSGRSPEEILNEPEMKYLPSKTRYQWRTQGRQWLMGNSAMGESYAEKFIAIRKQLLKTMQEQGVGLLLGSDSPQIFNVPGFSIQHELQSLVDAGLTPFQAIETGTKNVSKFYNAKGEFGTIMVGATADLILLDANPLEDIDNLKKKVGVFYKGNYLAKADIEKGLAEIATRHKE